MTKYFFTKPFSTPIGAGGIIGTRLYSKNKGDVVEGTVVNDTNAGEQQLKVNINKFPIQGAQTHIYIPMSFLTADSSEPTKNVVIGIIGLAAIFGLLKVTKVI